MTAQTSLRPQPTFAERQRGPYDLLVALFCSLLLISNIAAVKLIQIGPDWAPFGIHVLPLITDGGALLFPLTYVLGDVLAEVYGFKGARRAILIGFLVSVIAAVTFLIIGVAPAASDWGNQEAFDAILGFVPRIVVASLLGYLAGQLLNAWVLVRMKAGRSGLWTRLLGSSAVGNAADTTIFCLVAFGGVIGGWTMVNYILVGYVYKMTLEALLLPVTMRVIRVVKRVEPAYGTPA
ncbi:MAG TPA: queuosine precursor transporter [Arachnia sp.]|nr:queuosine precursor transporter [Arachnia sp.]HMT87677.1 queuosine precursor transporter [Arachnia sp.]